MPSRLASVLAVLCVLALAPAAGASGLEEQYVSDVAAYYKADDEAMKAVLAEELPLAEVPVCFFLGREAKLEAAQVAKLRKRGDSWKAIMGSRGVSPAALYVVIGANFQSKTYSPLFAKFTSVPESEWKKVDLTDEDVVNLVNLRMISRRHAYSIFDVMAMRDHGKGFPTVNNQVAELRKKRDQDEKAAAKKAADEARKAKESDGD